MSYGPWAMGHEQRPSPNTAPELAGDWGLATGDPRQAYAVPHSSSPPIHSTHDARRKTQDIQAVIFDLGGVVLESPMAVIARHEEQAGVEEGTVNRTVARAGSHGAWQRLERGELDRAGFLAAFARELQVAIDVEAMLSDIDESMRVRPSMLAAIRTLRAHGRSVAGVTNNWTPFPSDGLRREFDVFVESVVVGIRKPEPAIYRLVVGRLGVDPSRCAMLDDLGSNLKPARRLGMHTVKVDDPGQALGDLERLCGLSLTS